MSAGGFRKLADMTPEERAAEEVRRSRVAVVAGYAAAASMTPEQRTTRARKAAAARWAKVRAEAEVARLRAEAEGREVPVKASSKQRRSESFPAALLKPYLDQVAADHPEYSAEDVRRQAVALLRLDRAKAKRASS